MSVLGDILRALAALGDPGFWRVAIKSVGFTALMLLGALWGAGALLGVGADLSFSLPWIGPVSLDGGYGTALWVLFGVVISGLLMAPVTAVFANLFADEVADAVERRDYPLLPPANPAPMLQQLGASAWLLLAVIGWNLLALLIYLFLPPFAPFVFVAVNGWLLGREYVETIAMRRLPAREAVAFRKRHALQAWVLGGVMAASLALPLASLMTPLLGAAAATHLYHRLARRG